MRSMIAYPDKYRVELMLPGGVSQSQVSAAGNVWVEMSSGAVDADAELKDDFSRSVSRDLVPLLIRALDATADIAVMPDETLNGKPVTVLQVSLSTGGAAMLLIDPRTFEVRGLRYPTAAAPGAPQALETFDDYRETPSGLRVAYKAKVERDGATIERTVTSVFVNVALPADAFIRK